MKQDLCGALQAGELKGAALRGLLLVAFLGAPLPHNNVVKQEAAGEASRGDGEPGRHGVGVRVLGADVEAQEGRLVSLECAADLAGIWGVAEAEHREEGPDAAPVAGEDTGPCGGAGGEVEEDADEDVLGERAEPVLSCGGGRIGIAGGEPCALGGALAAAAAAAATQLHRGREQESRTDRDSVT